MIRALLIGVAVSAALPAFADCDLPPEEFDVGGATVGEVVENWQATIEADLPFIHEVAWGEADALCDKLSRAINHRPFSITGGLLGCMIPDEIPEVVYSVDPFDPAMAAQCLRHELGHVLGWPANHDRGIPTP